MNKLHYGQKVNTLFKKESYLHHKKDRRVYIYSKFDFGRIVCDCETATQVLCQSFGVSWIAYFFTKMYILALKCICIECETVCSQVRSARLKWSKTPWMWYAGPWEHQKHHFWAPGHGLNFHCLDMIICSLTLGSASCLVLRSHFNYLLTLWRPFGLWRINCHLFFWTILGSR